MKRIFWIIGLIVFLNHSLILFSGQEEWKETEFGSFKIERFWEETVGDYTCTYTLVSYKNTTDKIFNEKVTIRATIYDSQKKMIDTNTRSFFAHEYGPIRPGFEGTVKIPIECAKGQAKSVSVRIDSAK